MRSPFGFKVTGVYHDSSYQRHFVHNFMRDIHSVVFLFYAFSEIPGGGVMNLVCDSSFSSSMASYVLFE